MTGATSSRTGRVGRRPGRPETRNAILTAAREAFAGSGYAAASMRQIARAAGVDAALIHHYFGTKHELFLAALGAPIDPSTFVPLLLDGPAEQIGQRIVSTLMGVWDSDRGGPAAAMVRSAVADDNVAALLREFVQHRLLAPVLAGLGADPADAPLRATLAASQIAGLVMVRYIIRAEPLASVAPSTIIATIGPTISHYLTGPLAHK